nr:hypothetical protein [Tanacetum cinerariifolium]
MNMSPENKAHFLAKKEAIHLILTRIGDEIYSIVDACQTAQEMWEAIERLQQGDSLNIQDVKTNLFWEFGKFTSLDGETMESYYIGFYKMIRNNLTVTTMKSMFNFFNNFSQNGQEQYDWLANTNEEVDEQEFEAYYSYMAKIQEVPTADSGMDSAPVEQVQHDDGYNVFPNDLQHSEQSESVSNTCLVETDDSNVIPDTPDICEDDSQNDQNDVESDDERVALANLVANITLDTKQTEFEKYKAFNDRTIDYEKLEHMYDVILQECVSNDVKCSYLQSLSDLDALAKLQCMYLHKVKECDCLAQKLSKQTEFVSKKVHNELLQHFAKVEKHSISLEIALQKCKEQVKNDTVCNEKASNVFRKERKKYIKIQDLKAKLQDKNIAISELKKLIEKGKGKSVDTKFDKPSVAQQPNAQRIPNPSVLGKPDPFSNSLEVYYVEGLNHNLFSVGQFCDVDWRLLSGCQHALLEIFRDETPEVLKDFLMMIQRNLHALMIIVLTDRGTEFLNKTRNAFFKEEGIEHQTSTARTPKQNGVVKRQNHTLVEAARTMLSTSQLPLFFWDEAIATACYTQNRSIIILTHGKTPYHILNDRKPSIKHLHIFGYICYITRDGENLDKMKEKRDPYILVGYSSQSKGYHVYNNRTRMIVESSHICFDEIKKVLETSVANNTSGLVPQ